MRAFTCPKQISTSSATFDVESTPHGGHLVRISSHVEGWKGLYRCDSRLMLLARCSGTPPFELQLDTDVRDRLLEIIKTICLPPLLPSLAS
jgi:hypothetical protein